MIANARWLPIAATITTRVTQPISRQGYTLGPWRITYCAKMKYRISLKKLRAMENGEKLVKDEIRARTEETIKRISAEIQRLWSKVHPGERIEGIRHIAQKEEARCAPPFHGVGHRPISHVHHPVTEPSPLLALELIFLVAP